MSAPISRRNLGRLFAPLFGFVAIAAAPGADAPPRTNPLLGASSLPYGAPPFDRIRDSDYEPAIEAGIRRRRDEIDAITNTRAPATFENTILAYERSGRQLGRVLPIFYGMVGANTDDALDRIDAKVEPELARTDDAIVLNQRLFARVATLYRKRARLHLDPESSQLLTVTYENMVRAGARLSSAKRARMQAIDERLATLQATFSRRLLAASKGAAFEVTRASALAGLSPEALANAASDAAAHGHTGSWRIEIEHATDQPALATLTDRTTRAALFDRSIDRVARGSANDTRPIIAQMARLRAEKAALLGCHDYASLALATEMVKTPRTVAAFLRSLVAPTADAIRRRRAALQTEADRSPSRIVLRPYDWDFYTGALASSQLHFDPSSAAPYFELHNVLENGLFYAANELYGITFRKRTDIPVWDPDVLVYEVSDTDGEPLALMYFDFYHRDNKRGGAWMSTFVDQSSLVGTKPVVYNVQNIPKPAAGKPTLLTPDEVHGMFHEFGHALHGFFSHVRYASLSGTNTSRDFVEFPSQFNEHWAFYPTILAHYAVDYRTGAPIPKTLVAAMVAADRFNGAYAEGEALAADELDLAWHRRPASAGIVRDVDAFESQALRDSGTDFSVVPPRYRSTYFEHIWSGGYAAGYYAYQWSAMLDDDAYAWFVDHGGPTRANGRRFRDLILSRGHTIDEATMFRNFYGKAPDVGPLLDELGLTANS